jgi:hypothetical protein
MSLNSQCTDFLKNPQFIEWRLLRTEESERFWVGFIREHPECNDALNEAIRKFSTVKLSNSILPQSSEDLMLNQLLDEGRFHNIRKRRIWYWSAAASMALLVVSSVIFLAGKDHLRQELVVEQTFPSNDIRLISGDKVMELGQDVMISLEGGKASATIEDKTSPLNLSAKEMNRLIVPAGKRSTLKLLDGTVIWLNSGTELGFYTDGTREITVKGEVYMEVAKAAGKPFYVNAPDFKVSVLGTKFNVSAYSDDEEHSVVLVEGRVEVGAIGRETIRLKPNERVSVTSAKMQKENVNASEYISWKDGILIFNDTPIQDVLKMVERYYNVDIYDKVLPGETCTGKLYLSDNIDEVMTSLSVLSTSRHNRENELIYKKNEQ